MTLNEWHVRLDGHFSGLRTEKAAGVPLFALEHGLNAEELDDLRRSVLANIARTTPATDAWLPWVVYLSEFGYEYSGIEFWPPFEERTPGWQLQDRYWARRRFRDFASKYGGATPSGPWAQQFTIICWPITHAILPRDLQGHLTRALYDLQHRFNPELLDSASSLGHLISVRSHWSTSRFQEFAEDELLVGHIARALLLGAEDESSRQIIHPGTLQRIVTDLQHNVQSREWLSQAQRRAVATIRMRGLGPRRDRRSNRPHHVERAREPEEKLEALAIQPTLLLRPTPEYTWQLLLEIPDFAPLLSRFPTFAKTLNGSRCYVEGGKRPLAPGEVLFGPVTVGLSQFPESRSVLLTFENSEPQLDRILAFAASIPQRAHWLFRIGADHMARQCRDMVVSPGNRYLLFPGQGAGGPGTRPIRIAGIDREATLLELPTSIPGNIESFLGTIGLKLVHTLDVTPVAVVPTKWDGEGYAEWLVGDRPVLQFTTDHVVKGMTIALGDDALTLSAEDFGTSALVELDALPLGMHRLELRAEFGDSDRAYSGRLDFLVREPRSVPPGFANRLMPLQISLDPVMPTLDDLWLGRSKAEVYGPLGQEIGVTFDLRDRTDQTLYKEEIHFKLPVTSEAFRRQVDKAVWMRNQVAAVYDSTFACVLTFDGGFLGSQSIRAERDYRPLRWSVRHVSGNYCARLWDDTAESEENTDCWVLQYRASTPDTYESLRYEDAVSEFAVPAEGVLLLAAKSELRATVVIPPENPLNRPAPSALLPRADTCDDIQTLLELVDLWRGAGTRANPLGDWTRDLAVRDLIAETFGLLGGSRWKQVERVLVRRHFALEPERLARSVSEDNHQRLLVERVTDQLQWFRNHRPNGRVQRLTEIVAPMIERNAKTVAIEHGGWDSRKAHEAFTRQSVDPARLVEFQLRWASGATGIQSWAAADIDRLIECTTPFLARLSRYVVLCVSEETDHERPLGSGPYQDWVWE